MKDTTKKLQDTLTSSYNISVDGNVYAGFFLDQSSGRQNITINDIDAEIAPNYDALIAFRSNTGTVLFPNLSNATMAGLAEPELGMVLFNVDHDGLYVYTQNNGFIPVSGQINPLNPTFDTITCTQSTSNLKDTNIDGILTANSVDISGVLTTQAIETKVIDCNSINADIINVNDILRAEDFDVETIDCEGTANLNNVVTNIVQFSSGNFRSVITAASSLATNTNIVLPADVPVAGQVLIAIDSQGNTEWGNFPIIGTFSGHAILNGIVGVTINSTAVTLDSRIMITRNIGAGLPPSVTTIGNLIVGSIIANTSFTVYSTAIGDNGGFDWLIINP